MQKKSVFRSTVIASLAAVFLFAGIPAVSFAAEQDNTPPGLVSYTISTRTVAWQGDATRGSLTVYVKTDEPTRGYIDITGNGRTTRINLSTFDYWTEHEVYWAPWDNTKKEPLPPGEYTLRLSLSDASLNQSVGIGLGTVTVVSEPNPKAVIDSVSANPSVVTPNYNSYAPITTLQFMVNRPVNMTPILRKNGQEYAYGPVGAYLPGVHTWEWNGRDQDLKVVPDGEYEIVFKYVEMAYDDKQYKELIGGKVTVKQGEYDIPASRLRQIVTGASFDQPGITPDGDGVNDTVSGSVTLAEKAKVGVWIINGAGVHVKQVLSSAEHTPGTYRFTWDGKDFMGGTALNGPYYIKVDVTDAAGANGYLPFMNAKVLVDKGVEISVPQPVQRVRVIADSTQMTVGPYIQGYTGKQGEIYTVLGYVQNSGPSMAYNVKVTDGVIGLVSVTDVELIDLDSMPVQWVQTSGEGVEIHQGPSASTPLMEKEPAGTRLRVLRQDGDWSRILLASGKQAYVSKNDIVPADGSANVYTVAAGDTLWKIAQKFGVTVDAIVKANGLDANKYLMIGQKLTIPSTGSQNGTVYTVQAGDTLWKIAMNSGVPIDAIVKANNLDVNKYLNIGQKLVIPPKGTIHTVQSGDTLWKIAQKYGTTVQNIAQLNQIDPNKPILIGQQLKVN
jgi:LysM repeat protein/flagellar hook assembly protein FlgD